MEHMKQSSETATRPRLSLSLDDSERRALVVRAAAQSVSEGRPVSVAEVARDAMRKGLAEARSEAA